jgi:hypothetical protein
MYKSLAKCRKVQPFEVMLVVGMPFGYEIKI